MLKGLVSRQPVWKTASVSLVVIALTLVVSLMLPSLSRDSVYAQAADIIKNSPEIRAVLGDSEPKGIQVLSEDEGSVTLLFSGDRGVFTTEVNLKSGKVIYVSSLPELTEAERQAAINIAESDLEVKALFDQGASIVRISPRYYDYTIGEKITRMVVEKGEEIWFAFIDIDSGCVLSFMKLQ